MTINIIISYPLYSLKTWQLACNFRFCFLSVKSHKMMKFFFNICLLNSSSFGAPRNILVSHERVRFLIQAVALKGPGTFANYKKTQVEEGKFCQASSSLLTAAEPFSPLPLLANFKKIMVVGTETTRRYLQELTNVLASDEYRANKDATTEETATIHTELNVIIAAVKDQKDFHGENAKYARTLSEKAVNDGEEPKSYLLSPEFKYTSEQHTLKWKSEQTGALEGSRSHSQVGWGKINAHHITVNDKLDEVLKALEIVKGEMDNILTEHRKHIVFVGASDVKKRNDVTEFFKTGYETLTDSSSVKPKDIPPVEKYKQSSGKTEPNIDGFGKTEAEKLGAYIIDLISKRLQTSPNPATRLGDTEFTAFLALKGSPAETMTRLSTTLNILYIKKKTEMSAVMTDTDLLTKHILPLMKDVRIELIELLKKMTSQLGLKELKFPDLRKKESKEKAQGETDVQFKDLAKVVYDDITRYPKGADEYGVKIDDSDTDQYDKYKGAVTKAMENNAIAEVHPRINLLFNVARRVHINMIGFVHALVHEMTADALSDPYTTILRFKAEEESKKLSAVSASELETMKKDLKTKIDSALTNARSASDCLLYGRYDVLMRNLKRAFFDTNPDPAAAKVTSDVPDESKWCASTRAEGMKFLDEDLGEKPKK